MHYTSREVYEFISKQTNDPIVERKTCAVSGQPFAIFQSDLDFYAKISPTFNGQKFQIPTPTLCPEERQRRRLSFRNERKLYRRQCDASKKSIISIYSPDKPYKVYDQKIRRSDSRDPMDYGMDFDFNKTFTKQFDFLLHHTPLPNVFNTNGTNSDYCNHVGDMKNCYLVGASRACEETLYGGRNISDKDCIDIYECSNCEHCYEIISCEHCYDSQYSQNLKHCSYCIACHSCDHCDHCIECTNLINKSYYYKNKKISKEEFNTLSQTYNLSYTTNKIHLTMLLDSSCEQSYGYRLANTKKCIFAHNINDGESGKYIENGAENFHHIYDGLGVGYDSSYCLEILDTGVNGSNMLFAITNHGCNRAYYNYTCYNCSDIFGCIGLRNKSYCIFNKQYTKEEYEIQVAKIIAHMQTTGERGEFFHPSLSPFGYNETVAQEYFPLERGKDGKIESKKDLSIPSSLHLPFSEFGYKRSNYNADPSLPAGVQTIEKKNYTEEQRTNLLQQDNLETQVFLCSVSSRPYRLQKAEIEFYRKHHLPIPDKHPDIRHEERMKLRPGRTLFLRTCDCCHKEMLSVYSQDHKGKVYCEECYQKEVYS